MCHTGKKGKEIPMKVDDVYRLARQSCGFLSAEHVAILAADPLERMRNVLVRCGAKRFICTAQDTASMIEMVESQDDYVRDVSIPASDPFWRVAPKSSRQKAV